MGEKRNEKGEKGERVGARDLQGAISDEWASVKATKKNRNERSWTTGQSNVRMDIFILLLAYHHLDTFQSREKVLHSELTAFTFRAAPPYWRSTIL